MDVSINLQVVAESTIKRLVGGYLQLCGRHSVLPTGAAKIPSLDVMECDRGPP